MSQILMDVFFFYRKNMTQLLTYIIPVSFVITVMSFLIANNFAVSDDVEKIKILVVVNFILNPVYLAGLIYLLSSLSNDRSISPLKCLGLGIYKWFALFMVSVFYGLLSGIGFFMFVLPGIWIFMRLILAPFLVALNGRSPIEAISESFRLTEKDFWSIAGTTMLIFLSIISLQQSLISILPDTTIVTIFISVVGDVLWSVLTVLWFRYYDLLINGN
ncbi:MAG: hypothetical protein QM479_09020 [Pseudomonadota bacterium]